MSPKTPQVESDAANNSSSRSDNHVLSDVPISTEQTFWQDVGVRKYMYPDDPSYIPILCESSPHETLSQASLPHEETNVSAENKGFPISRSLIDRLAVAPQKIRRRARSFDLTHSLRQLAQPILDRRQKVSPKADEEEQHPEPVLHDVINPNFSSPQPPAFELLVTPPTDDQPVETDDGHLTDEEIARRTAVRSAEYMRRKRARSRHPDALALSGFDRKKRSTSIG